jgi:hypothetical protein
MFQLGDQELTAPEEIWTRLFEHQKEGVQWLLDLHNSEVLPGGKILLTIFFILACTHVEFTIYT